MYSIINLIDITVNFIHDNSQKLHNKNISSNVVSNQTKNKIFFVRISYLDLESVRRN